MEPDRANRAAGAPARIDAGQGQRYFHHHHHDRDDRRDRRHSRHNDHHSDRQQRDRHLSDYERGDSRDDGDWFQGLVRTASTPRRDSPQSPTSDARHAQGGRSPHPQRDRPFHGEVPPRITDDGEAVSALDLVRNATGTRGQHGRQISTTILRTLTRRGWVFAAEPFTGDQTPSSVVQADDLVNFLLAGANAIGRSLYGGRLKCYHLTPGFAALVERIQYARDNHRRLAAASSRTHRDIVPRAVEPDPVKLEPVKLEPIKVEPVDASDPMRRDDGNDENPETVPAGAHMEPHAAPMATGTHVAIASHNGRDIDMHALELDAESERVYDTTVLERLADKARADRPLCVWECRGGMWRLVFAARPGAHPQRPWRIVAGSAETPNDNDDDREVVADTGPVWVDRARMIQQARVHMASPAGITAVATSVDCEPPPGVFCFAEDADALAFGNMWLSMTARQCLAHVHDADRLQHQGLVARLAVRLARAAVAADDAPHSAECRRLADALL
ncbi:hypothetical protein pclt_cds_39 [Pandoravirus celtis]|uniref:Uncharacterized protein n=1 Tax=Pandoravirus celtis TaxID=2568002 RepID=A0A4D6EFS5_9VIRU|nr:hypothetical protein pclt_cds_39 [Pandoravirus celtis]